METRKWNWISTLVETTLKFSCVRLEHIGTLIYLQSLLIKWHTHAAVASRFNLNAKETVCQIMESIWQIIILIILCGIHCKIPDFR